MKQALQTFFLPHKLQDWIYKITILIIIDRRGKLKSAIEYETLLLLTEEPIPL